MRRGGDTAQGRGSSRRRPNGSRNQRGAALVEFAILAPFLLLLLLGIIEFGYLFAQFNEVRHAVREGARYAAVSEPDRDGGGVGNSDVVDAVCDSINLPNATIDVQATFLTGSGDRGDTAKIEVTATIGSLTSAPLISGFLPSQLTNSAEFRLERDAKWSTFPTPVSC